MLQSLCICSMMYDTDQCHTHLNLLWVLCVWEGSFHMVHCVGCFGGTVLYVCIEYHI